MKVIRISDVVHEHLKKEAKAEGRTLQWLVENKLTSKTPPSQKITEVKSAEKNKSEPSAEVDDLIKAPAYDPVVDLPQNSGELNCCLNEHRPCKHWIWDSVSGGGYLNSLSGRFMEVEG